MTDIPESVWSGSFILLGVEVKCHTLSNGERIIEADSFDKLMDAMAGGTVDFEKKDDTAGFARWRLKID